MKDEGECLFNLILLFCFYLFIGIQIRPLKVLQLLNKVIT